jgi:hypothetical protein
LDSAEPGEVLVKKMNSALEVWTPAAAEVKGDDVTLHVPLHVLFGEAVDVARFFEAHWKPQKDASGNIVRRGLDSAAGKHNKRLTEKTGDEILSLQQAAQEAHTAYLLTVDPKSSGDIQARARFVLNEITAVLEWFFDDGIEDENDARLERLAVAHASDPDTMDALASALDDYAALAAPHRKDLDGLGDFDGALLDEAKSLAVALRDRPAVPLVLSDKARAALSLRNKVISLLTDRMATVRSAARFVFRDEPEIVRQVTSAYERRKRAAAKREAAKKKAPGVPPPA